ncbi:tyrosine-type recombinase/integrase [Haloglycomyces albus]|uniref:tyrosine-type recombinase/integrase n=1 Tax=Haloglycomyces albus TaxID=526067 RepID=UPI00046CF387|nr:site-specific integrase [Haloglycomyces albus]
MVRKAVKKPGDGSIYHTPDKGWRAYVYVTTPSGRLRRKYLAGGDDYDALHQRWMDLKDTAASGPVADSIPSIEAEYMYWLDEVIKPNREPSTYEKYEIHGRLYIIPYLGEFKIDSLSKRRGQEWMNEIRRECQCCRLGKDLKRRAPKRCCSVGKCCDDRVSLGYAKTVRATLRAFLNHAESLAEGYSVRNIAENITLASWDDDIDDEDDEGFEELISKTDPWEVEEAAQFLQSAFEDDDPMFEAYVMVIFQGMRKGEVLGATWNRVNWDDEEYSVRRQLQRSGQKLRHKKVKSKASRATIPLAQPTMSALKRRWGKQSGERAAAGEVWQDSRGLIFTTKFGTPIEPRNFNRSWENRCNRAGVRRITVHAGRKTCGSMLVELGVHPRDIMAILRHSNFMLTMNIYTKSRKSKMREAVDKLADLFNN